MTTETEQSAIAARAATFMAYVVAVTGAGAATLSLRAGALVEAALIVTVSLGVSALLAATATLMRALRAVEERLRRLEQQSGSAPR